MGGFSWIIFMLLQLITAWESAAITNKRRPPYRQQEQRSSVRNFRHISGPSSATFQTDWEVGLREAANQALLREGFQDPNLKELLVRAPLVGKQDTASPFGDVAVLARGQLYGIQGENFVFVQDPYQNDCDDCHNAKTRCTRNHCEIWKPRGLEQLLALWTVKRLRHRDHDDRHRYELEYTVSPISSAIADGFVTRNGRFDYAIPGHVFVVKTGDDSSRKTYRREPYPGSTAANRKHPQGHFKPEVLIGVGPDGRKHVLHSYPGFYSSVPVLPTYPQTNDPREVELYKNLIEALAAKTSSTQKDAGPTRFSLNSYGGTITKPSYDSYVVPQTPLVQLPTGQLVPLNELALPVTTIATTLTQVPTRPTPSPHSYSTTDTTKYLPEITKATIHYFLPEGEDDLGEVPSAEVKEMTRLTTQTTGTPKYKPTKMRFSPTTPAEEEEGSDFLFPVESTTQALPKSSKPTPKVTEEETDFLVSVADSTTASSKTSKEYRTTTTVKPTTVEEETYTEATYPTMESTVSSSKATKMYHKPTNTRPPPTYTRPTTPKAMTSTITKTATPKPTVLRITTPKFTDLYITTPKSTTTEMATRKSTTKQIALSRTTSKFTTPKLTTLKSTTKQIASSRSAGKFTTPKLTTPTSTSTGITTTKTTTPASAKTTTADLEDTEYDMLQEIQPTQPMKLVTEKQVAPATNHQLDREMDTTVPLVTIPATQKTKESTMHGNKVNEDSQDTSSSTSKTVDSSSSSKTTESSSMATGKTMPTDTTFMPGSMKLAETTVGLETTRITEATETPTSETTLTATLLPTTEEISTNTTLPIEENTETTTEFSKLPEKEIVTPTYVYAVPSVTFNKESGVQFITTTEEYATTSLPETTPENALNTDTTHYVSTTPLITLKTQATTMSVPPKTTTSRSSAATKSSSTTTKPLGDFLTANGNSGSNAPSYVGPLKQDYDEDDIFGSTKSATQPTRTTTREVTQSELAEELFGNKRKSKRFRSKYVAPKIIYSNFYQPSTTPMSPSTSGVLRETTKLHPLTRQSYQTSISFEVNAKNSTKADESEAAVPTFEEVTRGYQPIETTTVYTTENAFRDPKQAFDHVALQLVNHARSIDYLSRGNRTSRAKYKRKRGYVPKTWKVNVTRKQ